MSLFYTGNDIPEELIPYKQKLSSRFFEVRKKVVDFILHDVQPYTKIYKEEIKNSQNPWAQPPIFEEVKAKAKSRGLWNLFLPSVSGLSVLEYAPLAELIGMVSLANQAMNCSAPDTGNMEVLEQYGSEEQKHKWLEPLLQGKIRSCFAMTEPGVASSDATNISSTIERDSLTGGYVVNGHKWYISGAIRPECKIIIFLGKSNPKADKHKQHSMILIPMDTPGVKILRPMAVFGHEHDHAEIIFENVKVPKENLILGEGRGFEIAQGRLGPGRIHHCMRTIGMAELALASIIHRIQHREAFGSLLSEKQSIHIIIAEARIELTKCRQLCYLAASIMDEKGTKEARKYIAMIKVAAPRAALHIVDEAIQVHGAHGVSQDSQLSDIYTGLRTLRLADGPDVVHLATIAKEEIKHNQNPLGSYVSGTNPNIEKYKHLISKL